MSHDPYAEIIPARPRARVLPSGSPLAECIDRAFDGAGFNASAAEESERSVDCQVAVFLLSQPGGITAAMEYISGLRALGVQPQPQLVL